MAKKAIISLFLLGIAAGAVFAQDKKYQASIFGGVNLIFKYGSVEDYTLGGNDFPVTPAHTPPYFGLSLSYVLAKSVKAELDWRYVFSAKMTLTDPSDEDTVNIDSSKQYFTSLNIVYQSQKSKFRPYALVGGGINKLLPEVNSYISEHGYSIELGVPEKKTAFFIQGGGGVEVLFGKTFGVLAEVRLINLYTEPDNIFSLFAGIGMTVRF